MELKIIKSEKKPLLEREEYIVEIVNSVAPSNIELKKMLAEKLKKDENLILIKKINQQFGTQYINAICYVYSNPESIKKFERFKKDKKKTEEKK
ncbi:MAG: hypothetical protein QW041_00055 [Candidatus Pacearchaeota archaeon]